MFVNGLHRIVSVPQIYDAVQVLAGSAIVRRVLAAEAAQLSCARLVLDLGGGTGIYRGIWPEGCSHICLDLDPVKLQGYTNRDPRGSALLADGAYIPIRSDSINVIVCTAMSHHLPDAFFRQLLEESARVLSPSGVFLFLDAIWQPNRALSCLLWKLDRGSYPRTAEHLRDEISHYYQIYHSESFSVFHEYTLYVGARNSETSELR
jgi:SAM-dependent methyltransferase